MSFADQLGGLERLNEAERSLCRSAASLTVEAERLQAMAAQGMAIDNEALTRVANSQARVLATLRRGRPAPRGETPSLASYMSERRPGAASATMPPTLTAQNGRGRWRPYSRSRFSAWRPVGLA